MIYLVIGILSFLLASLMVEVYDITRRVNHMDSMKPEHASIMRILVAVTIAAAISGTAVLL